jgi:hypothetical protein
MIRLVVSESRDSNTIDEIDEVSTERLGFFSRAVCLSTNHPRGSHDS